MGYIPLGYRPLLATKDTTGLNVGNYTCAFTPAVINNNVNPFELYHLYLTAPSVTGINTTATLMINNGLWDITLTGQANGWDPAQPMLMTPGDTFFVLFNVAVPNAVVPEVTAWFRYSTT